MSSAFVSVQSAIVTLLRGGLTIPVYDHVPQDKPPPFVVVSDDTAIKADTKTYNSVAHNVTVDVYSSQRGLAEVKSLMDQLYSLLQRRVVAVQGVNATPPQFEFSDAFFEPEGSRGTMRFSMRTAA